jgi:hypothetical protein
MSLRFCNNNIYKIQEIFSKKIYYRFDEKTFIEKYSGEEIKVFGFSGSKDLTEIISQYWPLIVGNKILVSYRNIFYNDGFSIIVRLLEVKDIFLTKTDEIAVKGSSDDILFLNEQVIDIKLLNGVEHDIIYNKLCILQEPYRYAVRGDKIINFDILE